MLPDGDEWVVCDDGWRLAVSVLAPPSPAAACVLGHAMMVDRRTTSRLAEHLASRGIAVVWPDLRGHGRSGPRADEGGRWSYDDLVEQDAGALLAFARRRFPSLSVAAVGHSLFGHVALAYAARHRDRAPDRLVLLAANLWAARWEPSLRRWIEKRLLVEAMAAGTRVAGRFPTRRLRAGSDDEAAGYVAQLVGVARADDWVAGDGFRYLDALPSLQTPLLAMTCAGDRILCRPESLRAFVAPIPDATVRVVGRATGLASDGSHMALVTDPRMRPAWDEVADFLLG